MSIYRVDRAWADAFTPAIRQVLTDIFHEHIHIASSNLDTQQATDLVTASGIPIALRTRKAQYWRYQDITIRFSRPSGVATEADKLGHARYYCYAWMNQAKPIAWVLLDVQRLLPLIPKARKRATPEGETFAVIPLSQLKKCGAIIAAGGLAAPYAQKVVR